MILILLHMLMTPYTLVAIGALVAIAVGLYFTVGPAALLKIVFDIRVWLAIAAVLAVLAFAHSEQQAADLNKRLDSMTQQNTATEDAGKTTAFRSDQKAKRAVQASHVQHVLDTAKPADVEDAVMDAIAAERGDPLSSHSAPPIQKVPAPVVAPPAPTPQPEVKHVVQPAPKRAQVVPDRAPVPSPDGVRIKRPDVVVVP